MTSSKLFRKTNFTTGRILSVRWVASSKRTINAVLNNFLALYDHFKSVSTDVTRDSKERNE